MTASRKDIEEVVLMELRYPPRSSRNGLKVLLQRCLRYIKENHNSPQTGESILKQQFETDPL